MRSIAIITVLCLARALHAQDDTPMPAPGAPTLSVQVRVAAVTAHVRDKDNNLVLGLDKDAFTLREDGKVVPIRYFNRDSDLPLMIGLMVDTSGSQRDYFTEEAESSATFLHTVLTQSNDKAFLVRFDSSVLLLQNITSSVPRLERALTFLADPDPANATHRGGTLLFDAICATAQKVIGQAPGRRALIILTDGDDNGSHYDLDQALKQAQLADVAVYSVLYTREGEHPQFGSTARPSGIDVMRQISKATGGRAFVVSQRMPIETIYAAIEDDLRSQYRLGFTPVASKAGKFHTIELKTTDKHLTVQSRTGYFTP